ncbi:hypothetical protein PR048_019133 [Dryococelus australis]|uniref:Uncharacterized protein n=1 Tax=Dryococelus australis TaxID=614101 RepID=A0ABQ9H2Q3_9NEOP|nr:hypothetical protein PR048_019133 [Dryococelus australis]
MLNMRCEVVQPQCLHFLKYWQWHVCLFKTRCRLSEALLHRRQVFARRAVWSQRAGDEVTPCHEGDNPVTVLNISQRKHPCKHHPAPKQWGCVGVVVRQLACHLDEPVSSIPGGPFSDFRMSELCRTMSLVCGFSRGSPVFPTLIPALLHPHLVSPESDFSTSMLRAHLISSLIHYVTHSCTVVNSQHVGRGSSRRWRRVRGEDEEGFNDGEGWGKGGGGLDIVCAGGLSGEEAMSADPLRSVGYGSEPRILFYRSKELKRRFRRRLNQSSNSGTKGNVLPNFAYTLVGLGRLMIRLDRFGRLLTTRYREPIRRRNARVGGKRRIPEEARRSAASSVTIPTCEDPRLTRPGIEPGSPRDGHRYTHKTSLPGSNSTEQLTSRPAGAISDGHRYTHKTSLPGSNSTEQLTSRPAGAISDGHRYTHKTSLPGSNSTEQLTSRPAGAISDGHRYTHKTSLPGSNSTEQLTSRPAGAISDGHRYTHKTSLPGSNSTEQLTSRPAGAISDGHRYTHKTSLPGSNSTEQLTSRPAGGHLPGRVHTAARQRHWHDGCIVSQQRFFHGVCTLYSREPLKYEDKGQSFEVEFPAGEVAANRLLLPNLRELPTTGMSDVSFAFVPQDIYHSGRTCTTGRMLGDVIQYVCSTHVYDRECVARGYDLGTTGLRLYNMTNERPANLSLRKRGESAPRIFDDAGPSGINRPLASSIAACRPCDVVSGRSRLLLAHPRRSCRPAASSGMIPTWEGPGVARPGIEPGTVLAERLACTPPTEANPFRSPAGSSPPPPQVFARGTIRTDDAGGSRIFSMIFRPPLPFHSRAGTYSPQSPSSSLKNSLSRAAHVTSLTSVVQVRGKSVISHFAPCRRKGISHQCCKGIHQVTPSPTNPSEEN